MLGAIVGVLYLVPSDVQAELWPPENPYYYYGGQRVSGRILSEYFAIELPQSFDISLLESHEPSSLPEREPGDWRRFLDAGLLLLQEDPRVIDEWLLGEIGPEGEYSVWPIFLPDESQDVLILTDEMIYRKREHVSESELRDCGSFGACACDRVPWCRARVTPEETLPEKRATRSLEIANCLVERKLAWYAHPNYVLIPESKKGDPSTCPEPAEFHLTKLSVAKARALITNIPSSTAVIMVLDDGFDISNSAFKDNLILNEKEMGADEDQNCYIGDVYGWNFSGTNDLVAGGSTIHGDSMASLAVGTGTVPGVCQRCGLVLAVKPRAPFGYFERPEDNARSLFYAFQRGADVVSASFHFSQMWDVVDDAIDILVSKDIPVVVASGNLGLCAKEPCFGSPASHDDAIVVGASDRHDRRRAYSRSGLGLDILAPSRTKHCRYGGTSGAAATAAGVTGLLLTLNPSLTTSHVREILRATAEKIESHDHGSPLYFLQGVQNLVFGHSKTHGNGRLNACRALSPVAKMSVTTVTVAGGLAEVEVQGHAVSPFGLSEICLETPAGSDCNSHCRKSEVSCRARWNVTVPVGSRLSIDATVHPENLATGQASGEYHRTAREAEDYCGVTEISREERSRTVPGL